jgi:hypothetical protein
MPQNETSQYEISQAFIEYKISEYLTQVDKLTKSGGILNEFREFVHLNLPHQSQMYLPLTLSVLTAILQTHLARSGSSYHLIVAPPQSNKSTLLNTIRLIMNTLDIVIPEWPSSFKGLSEIIEEYKHQGVFVTHDELLSKFCLTHIQHVNNSQAEVLAGFCDLYTNNFLTVHRKGTDKDEKSKKNIKNISVGLMGIGTEDQLRQLLKHKDKQFIASGWFSRFSFWENKRQTTRLSPRQRMEIEHNRLEVPKSILECLKKLMEWKGHYQVFETEFNPIGEHKRLKFTVDESSSELLETDMETERLLDSMVYKLKQKSLFEAADAIETYGSRTLDANAMYYANLLFVADCILIPGGEALPGLLAKGFITGERVVMPDKYYKLGHYMARINFCNAYIRVIETHETLDDTYLGFQLQILDYIKTNKIVNKRLVERGLRSPYRGDKYWIKLLQPTLDQMVQSSELTVTQGKTNTYSLTELGQSRICEIMAK